MRLIATLVLLMLLVAAGALAYARLTALDARGEPSAWEAQAARAIRAFAVPAAEKSRRNPLPQSAEAIEAGLEHFADHCASCHANDGSGKTDLGRGLWPKPPDMRAAPTQDLTDGELAWIIDHGVRFTGMPGWGTSDPNGTWQLVQFIRALPHLSSDQLAHMQDLNPRSPEEVRQAIEEEQFLNGGK